MRIGMLGIGMLGIWKLGDRETRELVSLFSARQVTAYIPELDVV